MCFFRFVSEKLMIYPGLPTTTFILWCCMCWHCAQCEQVWEAFWSCSSDGSHHSTLTSVSSLGLCTWMNLSCCQSPHSVCACWNMQPVMKLPYQQCIHLSSKSSASSALYMCVPELALCVFMLDTVYLQCIACMCFSIWLHCHSKLRPLW